jgi:hypothetical protein
MQDFIAAKVDRSDPKITVYYTYQVGDVYSASLLASLEANPSIKPVLKIIEVKNNITEEQLNTALVGSTMNDSLVNGLVSLYKNFLDLFNKPGYTINPKIFNNLNTVKPILSQIQLKNLSNRFVVFSYQPSGTSYSWRKDRDALGPLFSTVAFDTLQVQTQLSNCLSPNDAQGAMGIIEFDNVTLDRKYPTTLHEDLDINGKWVNKRLDYNDPIYGEYSVSLTVPLL